MNRWLLLIALASPAALADGIYAAGGFDFRPDAFDLALGYQTQYLGIEASIIKEDPRLTDRQRNQVKSLDLLGLLPLTGRATAFIKAGPSHFRYDEAHPHLVNGRNVGVGIDYALEGHWSVRSTFTYLWMHSYAAFNQEHLFSLGMKYSF